jgi:hypothetical protein
MINRAEIITDKAKSDNFSFLFIKAIHEILMEFIAINIIESTKNVFRMYENSSPLKTDADIVESKKKTIIV